MSVQNEADFHGQLRRAAQDGLLQNELDHADVGFSIETLDSMITVMEMECVAVDIWQEDESDIMLHLVPPNHGMEFPRYQDFFRPQLERAVVKVMGADFPVRASEFGWRHGDTEVSRKSDSKWKGCDLIQLRLIGQYRRPLAAKRIIDAMKLFNHVLKGSEPPLDRPTPRIEVR